MTSSGRRPGLLDRRQDPYQSEPKLKPPLNH
jgi:hypothetical protein